MVLTIQRNELGHTIDSFVFSKVSNIFTIVLGPLLKQRRVILAADGRPYGAVPPFSECHFSVTIGVSDNKKVAVKTVRLL
jgi:hypothetical protein